MNDPQRPVDRSSDSELLARVAEAFAADLPPVPSELLSAAAAAAGWMDLDTELATVLSDSATDELVGARASTSTRRTLQFAGAGLTVSVTIDEHAFVLIVEPGDRYVGRLAGPGTAVDVETDDDGQFSTSRWPAPVRVELDLATGRFVSPWVIG